MPEFLNKPATSSTIQTVKRQTRSFKPATFRFP